MFDWSGGCGEYVPDLGQCGVCVGGGGGGSGQGPNTP